MSNNSELREDQPPNLNRSQPTDQNQEERNNQQQQRQQNVAIEIPAFSNPQQLSRQGSNLDLINNNEQQQLHRSASVSGSINRPRNSQPAASLLNNNDARPGRQPNFRFLSNISSPSRFIQVQSRIEERSNSSTSERDETVNALRRQNLSLNTRQLEQDETVIEVIDRGIQSPLTQVRSLNQSIQRPTEQQSFNHDQRRRMNGNINLFQSINIPSFSQSSQLEQNGGVNRFRGGAQILNDISEESDISSSSLSSISSSGYQPIGGGGISFLRRQAEMRQRQNGNLNNLIRGERAGLQSTGILSSRGAATGAGITFQSTLQRRGAGGGSAIDSSNLRNTYISSLVRNDETTSMLRNFYRRQRVREQALSSMQLTRSDSYVDLMLPLRRRNQDVLINIEDLDAFGDVMDSSSVDNDGVENAFRHSHHAHLHLLSLNSQNQQLSLFEYDSDWSEIEDLINEVEQESSKEEEFMTQILNNYGTLALVFYKRFRETTLVKLLEKESSNSIKKLQTTIKNVLYYIQDILRKQEVEGKICAQMENEYYQIKEIIQMVPSKEKLNKFLMKQIKILKKVGDGVEKEEKNEEEEIEQQERQQKFKEKRAMKEIVMLKILLDFQITIQTHLDGKHLKDLKNYLYPLAIKLHKAIPSSKIEEFNQTISLSPWQSSETNFVTIEKTRKQYLDSYESKLDDLNLNISNAGDDSNKNKKTKQQSVNSKREGQYLY